MGVLVERGRRALRVHFADGCRRRTRSSSPARSQRCDLIKRRAACSSGWSAWGGWAPTSSAGCMRDGHDCVVYDRNPSAVSELAGEGATGGDGLDELVGKLDEAARGVGHAAGRRVTEETVDELGDFARARRHDHRRRQLLLQRRHPRAPSCLRDKHIHYVDVGTSGGVWGLERGYCMMIGGEKRGGRSPRSDLRALAPGNGDIERTPGRAGRAMRAPSRATSMPARTAPATSSRWCITASSTG